jgi:serine/threonine-protein kinase
MERHRTREGQVLKGKYLLEAPIGAGASGVVYRATNLHLERVVAIKVLHAELSQNPEIVSRFVREARTANVVRHRHIVDVLDIDTDEDGTLFIVQEYLRGEDLATRLERAAGGLPWDESLLLIMPVAMAVGVAHAKGIVHRDLKPENVFLTRVTGELVPKVLDFGISKLPVEVELKRREARGWTGQDARLTGLGEALGTPAYMSPEQIQDPRAVDARSDVWSLGVMLFELLAGVTPYYDEDARALVAKILAEDPPSLGQVTTDVPAQLVQIVDRCLSKLPDGRYAHAWDLARALAEAQQELRPTLRPLVPQHPSMPHAAWPISVPSQPGHGPPATPGDQPWEDDEPTPEARPVPTPRPRRPESVAPLGDLDDGPPTTAGSDAVRTERPIVAELAEEVRPRPMRAAHVAGRGLALAEPSAGGAGRVVGVAAALLVVLGIGGGALFWMRRGAPAAPVAAPTSAATAAAERAEVVCEAARQRLSAGAPLGLDVAGWVVELWLGRAGAAIDADPALAAAVGRAGGEIDLGAAPAPEILPQGDGVVLRFGGAWVPRFFDPEGRDGLLAAAERIARSAGADRGALFARCAHLGVRDVGVWYLGRDDAHALAALLLATGAHADPPALDPQKLGDRPFDALVKAVGKLDDAAVESALRSAGARVQRTPAGVDAGAGPGTVLRFPFGGPTRAARVSRDLAALAGL